MTLDKYAFWMSSPNFAYLEIAASKGFRRVVLDIEHNSFVSNERESLVVAARAMGLEVFCKIEGPESIWVQRALDLNVDGIIIPHIGRIESASAIFDTTKFPPLGTRSYAGGRSANYAPVSDNYFLQSNQKVRCLPMIETAEALEDIEAIISHPCVDGVFVGPFDLALTRGRGNYNFSEADQLDIIKIAKAAAAANKPWWMPAWSAAEQEFCKKMGAEVTIVAAEHQVISLGLAQVTASLS